jgi:hypothetical protein
VTLSPTSLRIRRRWFGIALALLGVGVCLSALLGFITMLWTNNLPSNDTGNVRDYYVVVGRSYSQGFTVGFFLCLFLSLVAVTVRDQVLSLRRRRARLRVGSQDTSH